MKKMHWIFALLLVAIALSGCNDEQLYKGVDNDDDVPEGMVRLHITPGMMDQQVVTTRSNIAPAPDETIIADCRVLVFDKDPTTDLANTALSQPPAVATWNTTSNRLDVLLYEEPSVQRYILVLANLSDASKNWLDAQDTGVLYPTIQQRLVHTLPTSGFIRINPKALPLSGWMAASVEIKKTASPTVLNPGNSPAVNLTREVARIDVDATATTALNEKFEITGAGVANCPRTSSHLPDMAGKITAWDVTRVAACDLQTQEAADNLKGLVYTYEHDGAAGTTAEHPLRIVIRGKRHGSTTESFYGIDIVYVDKTTTQPSMVIRRNNIYKIKLNKVRKDGYATFAEAAHAASFNTVLDADISVTDPYAHDIVTNGRQYLGVTNTEFVLYPFDDQESSNLTIASFAYTCDPSWMTGQIILPKGITLPAGTQQSLTVSSYTVQRDLVVNIDPSFDKDVIVLHIGNLKKEIKIRRMKPTSAAGSIYSNYYEGFTNSNIDPAFREFKIGEVINFSATTNWLKVATTDDVSVEAALSNRVVTGQGGIYIHVANNFAYNAGAALPREAGIYLSGDTQGERIKVHVQQPVADIYENITKIEPFAYVGAFWRHNQTAERIIRMYGKQNSDGSAQNKPDFWWQANVVAGQEWIVMDTSVPGTTPGGEKVRHYVGGDSGTPNPYGIDDDANTQFGDDIETSASCQVNSKLRTVNGKGNYIYFRIGLTGKLGSASSSPRYGLIIISYGVNSGKIDGYHPIYVRQGEAADYLMRPFDPITTNPKDKNNQTYPSRPSAVRISPFNLDAQDNIGRAADDNSYKGSYPIPIQGGTFTTYPSRTGCYFLGTRRSFSNSIVALPASTQEPPGTAVSYTPAWESINESCPKGYRRINDGANDKQNSKGDIIGSEIRQSLMLFPAQGGDWELKKTQAALTNQYRGYLADGYFDRLQIGNAENGTFPKTIVPLSIVKSAKVGQATNGALFFNPNNYASIFIPFGGEWGGASGIDRAFRSRGQNATLVTSTPGTSGYADAPQNACWYLWVGNGFDAANKDFTSMYPSPSPGIPTPIRCVRDDRPIIETGGELDPDNPGTGSTGSGTTIDGINRLPNPNDQSHISARHAYMQGNTKSLQQQIEAEYQTVEKRKQIGSIVISGDKALTAADYQYLNAWADAKNTAGGLNIGDFTGHNLRHINIHGNTTTGNSRIPSGAFTSSQWITIELRSNIHTIEDGAFAASLTPGLKTLIVDYLDPVSANGGAFLFNTTQVNLRLNGDEWDKAKTDHDNDSNDPKRWIWKTKTWAGIRLNN